MTGANGAPTDMWLAMHGELSNTVLVLHTCDNPPCIRPEHLWLGSHQDNHTDRSVKNRQPAGERNGRCKIGETGVREMFRLRKLGHKHSEIAQSLGVSATLVSVVLQRKLWKKVKL